MGAENFSVIWRATLNLLKADKVKKSGIKNKRFKVGWDKSYMLSILGVNTILHVISTLFTLHSSLLTIYSLML